VSLVEGITLFADLRDQALDAGEIARKQLQAVVCIERRSDQRLREMARQECGEGEPARGREHRATCFRGPALVAKVTFMTRVGDLGCGVGYYKIGEGERALFQQAGGFTAFIGTGISLRSSQGHGYRTRMPTLCRTHRKIGKIAGRDQNLHIS